MKRGCSANLAKPLDEWSLVPGFLSRTRKSSLTVKEKLSKPHWRNVTVGFQVREARLQSSEFRTRHLNQRSQA